MFMNSLGLETKMISVQMLLLFEKEACHGRADGTGAGYREALRDFRLYPGTSWMGSFVFAKVKNG
jgi:hypothetical protein